MLVIPIQFTFPSWSSQAFRLAARPRPHLAPKVALPLFARYLSSETRAAIDKAVASAPVVLFMKGTPETPQCGFSRASIQILGLQGVDPAKFTAFNVLEDEELRQGMSLFCEGGWLCWLARAVPWELNRWKYGQSGIKEYSEWPTIPQLYVDKEFVGGCDILVTMHQNGELAKLLEEKKVLAPSDSEGANQES